MQPTFPAKTTPPEPAVPPPYRESDRWQLVERILKSHGFAKSPRLSSFLTYICTCALEGRSEDAQEQQIGIHVFGRSPAYNPSEDSVVRSQARLIRQKLEEYFEDEGRNEPMRIVVPKGTYFPQFVPYSVSSSAEATLDRARVPEADARAAPSGPAGRSSGIRSFALGLALLLVVGLLSADIWVRQRKSAAYFAEYAHAGVGNLIQFPAKNDHRALGQHTGFSRGVDRHFGPYHGVLRSHLSEQDTAARRPFSGDHLAAWEPPVHEHGRSQPRCAAFEITRVHKRPRGSAFRTQPHAVRYEGSQSDTDWRRTGEPCGPNSSNAQPGFM